MKHARLHSGFLFICILVIPLEVIAWGERGHDLITRVAVQKMRADSADDQNLMRPFLLKDHMLAHLSNTPDIVWRADYMGEEAKALNSPTHYISLEKTVLGVERWDDLPRDFAKYRELCKVTGHEPEDVGTAPWRVLQFYKLLVGELTGLDGKPEDLKVRHVNQALMYAGLMSHFVGDLANPHHTSANHDGQLTGNKGLHAYFETMVVAELPLNLAKKVLKKSMRQRLWLKNYSRKERKKIQNDPQALVWALVADSHTNVKKLTRLDNRYSIVSKSPIAPDNREPALRKPAEKVAKRYERFVVERMAIGADVLASLWQLAWRDAGSPDMSSFQSYEYRVQPPFITPSYEEVD